MKVLFAVSNDNITTSVVNKYQQKYKEIITNKNVYYFNAIIKELQKNKNYDAIVIGEDLEPISNNNYEAIDKFLFEKLDSISDEAAKPTGEDIPIIFICSDRRTQSDSLLIKLFGIGIYNAIIGNDRSIDTVCNLINKPRNKKEAKFYYRVESDEVSPYERSNDEEVSESEIQNILAHYRKIGLNPKKCVESFNSIAEQYNDTQLRIIIKFLPKEVKSILEVNSPIFQKLVNNGTVLSNGKYVSYNYNQNNGKMDILTKDLKKTNLSKPVIIPSTINIEKKNNNQRNNLNNNINQGISKNMNENMNNNINNNMNNNFNQNLNLNQNNMNRQIQNNQYNNPNVYGMNNIQVPTQFNLNNSEYTPMQNAPVNNTPMQNTTVDNMPMQNATFDNTQYVNEPIPEQEQIVQEKRGRGRPRKNPEAVVPKAVVQFDEFGQPIKRKRGRPRKEVNQTAINEKVLPEPEPLLNNNNNNNMLGFEEEFEPLNNNKIEDNEENVLPGFGLDSDLENLFSLDESNENIDNNIMPGFESVSNSNNVMPDFEPITNNNNAMPDYEPINNNNNAMPDYEPVQNNSSLPGFEDSMVNVYDNIYSSNQNNNIFDNPYESNTNVQPSNEALINTSNTNVEKNSINNNVITGNGKLVSFVGTSKNGTSFIVNNLAQMLSNSNVKTAILDLTQNKNSYYMFTNNDQNLMQIAVNSIKELSDGRINGVNINRNLSVFTSLPDEKIQVNLNTIMTTLSNNFDVILIDCDFNTDIECFKKSNEIYLIQTMDTFTIQPLTKFLSDLKLKNALDESKLRIVINKYIKLKKLNERMIIGGMSKYNEPSMTLQRDLFNSQTIKYTIIPFETETYAKYLENIAMCEINLNGYSQNFLNSMEQLKAMVYPLISGSNKPNINVNKPYTEEKRGLFGSKKQATEQKNTQFTSNINDTLNKMRSNNL